MADKPMTIEEYEKAAELIKHSSKTYEEYVKRMLNLWEEYRKQNNK